MVSKRWYLNGNDVVVPSGRIRPGGGEREHADATRVALGAALVAEAIDKTLALQDKLRGSFLDGRGVATLGAAATRARGTGARSAEIRTTAGDDDSHATGHDGEEEAAADAAAGGAHDMILCNGHFLLLMGLRGVAAA